MDFAPSILEGSLGHTSNASSSRKKTKRSSEMMVRRSASSKETANNHDNNDTMDAAFTRAPRQDGIARKPTKRSKKTHAASGNDANEEGSAMLDEAFTRALRERYSHVGKPNTMKQSTQTTLVNVAGPAPTVDFDSPDESIEISPETVKSCGWKSSATKSNLTATTETLTRSRRGSLRGSFLTKSRHSAGDYLASSLPTKQRFNQHQFAGDNQKDIPNLAAVSSAKTSKRHSSINNNSHGSPYLTFADVAFTKQSEQLPANAMERAKSLNVFATPTANDYSDSTFPRMSAPATNQIGTRMTSREN